MVSRRFRHLEREPAGAAPGEDGAPDEADGTFERAPELAAPVAARARSLERDGAILVDAAAPDTDFCRTCRFENRAGTARCLNCGTPLGGPEQEPFDEEMRGRRAARRPAREAEAAAPAAAGAAATPGGTEAAAPLAGLDVEHLLRAAERDEPGFGTVIASGALVACIFALVSIPLRRLFGGSAGAPGGAGELVVLVAITAGIWAGVRRKLRRL